MRSWNWEALTSSVQQVINEDGIGTPSALRLTIHDRGNESDAEQLLRDATDAATSWFGAPCCSTYTIGGGNKPTVAALKWPSGQSAILGVSVGAKGPIGGSAMLMGSRGTIYHELTSTESWSD